MPIPPLVLVVGDDPAMLTRLGAAIEVAHFRVVTMQVGDLQDETAAASVLGGLRPDAVVYDVARPRGPGASGFGALYEAVTVTDCPLIISNTEREERDRWSKRSRAPRKSSAVSRDPAIADVVQAVQRAIGCRQRHDAPRTTRK